MVENIQGQHGVNIYSKQQLMDIRKSLTNRPRIPDQAFNTIRSLKLLKPLRGRGITKKQVTAGAAVVNKDQQKSSNRRTILAKHSNTGIQQPNHQQTTKLPPLFTSSQSNGNKNIVIASLNARSVRNKTLEITDLITEQNIDVLAITQTWLKPGEKDQATRGDLCPPGYELLEKPRPKGKGGGIAIIHKSSLKIQKVVTPSVDSFEILETLININSDIVRLGVVYRPPTGCKTGYPMSTFLEELESYAYSRVTMSGKLLLLGNFNLHFENQNNKNTKKFQDILYATDLVQHVNVPTHIHGHCLDLVVTRTDELDIRDLTVHGAVISDHSAVTLKLPYTRPKQMKKTVTSRNYRDINLENFKQDIMACNFVTTKSEDIEELSQLYNISLTQVLDKHAPPVTKQVTDRSQSPWFTEECKRLKTSKRLAERRYQKHKLTVNLDLWRKALQDYKLCCTKAKSTYYQQKIAENSGNQKELFKVVNTLLHKKKDNRLPTFTDPSALANKFLEFFQTKIDNIRKSFSTVNTSRAPTTRNVPQLQQLSEVTCEEVLKFIQETNNKCCHLDPIPTTLLKSIVDCILPSLTRMVNASIRSSTFPTEWKTATVTPLIKKPDSDPEDMKNFRPVSNLSYISKLTEKIVMKQIDEHLDNNNLREPLQSAYRSNHSTETALVKIVNDLRSEVDNKKCVLLVLLDMSASFDKVEQSTLLKRFETDFGIEGSVNQWLRSYFTGRSQRVNIQGTLSEPKGMKCGMPQGSIIGPKGYPPYVSPIFAIARASEISIHMYHDHMLHRTGLWTEAQVRGSKATERLSNKKIQQSHTHKIPFSSLKKRWYPQVLNYLGFKYPLCHGLFHFYSHFGQYILLQTEVRFAGVNNL